MKAAEIYHTGITILMDIIEDDPDALMELRSAMQFLKKRRIEALERETVIPAGTLSVRVPVYKKGDEESNQTKPTHE